MIRHIETIIEHYDGHPPLHLYLKNFFREHPKLGSRDRKSISEAVYIFYRFALFYPKTVSPQSVIQQGLQKIGSQNIFLKSALEKEIGDIKTTIPYDFKLGKKNIPLSSGISEENWLQSQFRQPDLFVRLRGDVAAHLKILDQNKVIFQAVEWSDKAVSQTLCLRLPNTTKLDKILPKDAFVVQDLSTQQSILKVTHLYANRTQTAHIWDTCAGAGGKSILWKEYFPKDFILATDIRPNILHNLRQRAKLYRLRSIKTQVLDVANIDRSKDKTLAGQAFDVVICDVPCSGSGTWSRTPERFYFFRQESLENFKNLQFSIAASAARFVKKGGLFVYITCSVFEVENESVVEKFQGQTGMQLLHRELINGLERRSDSIFLAVLKNDNNGLNKAVSK